jgi:hypothetical protein
MLSPKILTQLLRACESRAVRTACICTSSSTSHTLSLGCGLHERPVKMSDAKCMHSSTLRIFESRSIGLSDGFANSCYQTKDSCGGCVGVCGGVECVEWRIAGAKTDCLRRLWPLALSRRRPNDIRGATTCCCDNSLTVVTEWRGSRT